MFPSNRPLLYYITDASGRPDRLSFLLDRIRAAAVAELDLVQIRERDLSGREQYELASAIQREVNGWSGQQRPRLLLNSRPDLAMAAGLAGVHLPGRGLEIGAVRATYPNLIVGKSCHSAEEVRAAAAAGSHFCVLGPIYPTPSKQGMGEPLGPEVLAIGRGVGVPVLALGGIDELGAKECLGAGAAGIAAIRLFQDNSSPQLSARLRAWLS